ncbi:uncharacterized protein J4E79_010428 [Alternaria viburni]|uniref:uncharacterized protein n=1 Tax=Alternaria viburni TaxID=566460 RepID=UPI0020C30CF9|nr:uncharacterized protein J4E79_010428 [Alternaria viburni]KAI4647276.1 hypothetical protein J4E79_010428 [Alternaria viburni]
MPRPIYLIVFNSPLFPAHWGLWIPHPSSSDPQTGTYLNATGDAASGFSIEFERNYEIGADGRRHQLISLGDVADEHVVDVTGDGKWSVDQIARDRLEEVVLGVKPPGPSLVAADSKTWIRDAVAALVEAGIMDEEALRIVEKAPKN